MGRDEKYASVYVAIDGQRVTILETDLLSFAIVDTRFNAKYVAELICDLWVDRDGNVAEADRINLAKVIEGCSSDCFTGRLVEKNGGILTHKNALDGWEKTALPGFGWETALLRVDLPDE